MQQIHPIQQVHLEQADLNSSEPLIHTYLMRTSLISCPPIPSGLPQSTCSPCHGSQDTVHTRQMCEESETNKIIMSGHVIHPAKQQCCQQTMAMQKFTSSSTKNGAIRKAWTRLSRRAGARFCKDNKIYK